MFMDQENLKQEGLLLFYVMVPHLQSPRHHHHQHGETITLERSAQ